MTNEGLKFAALALGVALVIVIIVLIVKGHKDKYEVKDNRRLGGTGAGCCSLTNNPSNCGTGDPGAADQGDWDYTMQCRAGETVDPTLAAAPDRCICNGSGTCEKDGGPNGSAGHCKCKYNLDTTTACGKCKQGFIPDKRCDGKGNPCPDYPTGAKCGKAPYTEICQAITQDGVNNKIDTACITNVIPCGTHCKTCIRGSCAVCDAGYKPEINKAGDAMVCTLQPCLHGAQRNSQGVCSCPWGYANHDHDGGEGVCGCVVNPRQASNFPMTGGSTDDKEDGYQRPNKKHDEVYDDMKGCDVMLVCPWGEGTTISPHAHYAGKGCKKSKSGECYICARHDASREGPDFTFNMTSYTGKEGPHHIHLPYCSDDGCPVGGCKPDSGTVGTPPQFSNIGTKAAYYPSDSGQVYVGPSTKNLFPRTDPRGTALMCPCTPEWAATGGCKM